MEDMHKKSNKLAKDKKIGLPGEEEQVGHILISSSPGVPEDQKDCEILLQQQLLIPASTNQH